MPGPLLHAGALVFCAHAGEATPTVPSPRVLVSGQPIVTQPTPYVVAGCSLAAASSPFCVTAAWVTGATTVLSEGAPVLLLDSQAVCAPTGGPLLPVVTQTRVTGT